MKGNSDAIKSSLLFVAMFVFLCSCTRAENPNAEKTRETITILNTLAYVQMRHANNKGKEIQSTEQLSALSKILADSEEMDSLPISEDWQMLKANVFGFYDAWNNPLKVIVDNDIVKLTSGGVDQMVGTEDDLFVSCQRK